MPFGTNYIKSFEAWLTTAKFVIFSVILILCNSFVYLWWFNRPVFEIGGRALNTALLQGLIAEKKELEVLLDADCSSESMKSYERGEKGPLTRSPESSQTNQSSEKMPDSLRASPKELVALLDSATVRVIAGDSVGTGFFINKNTVVTNRHVIEEVKNKKIYVTSKSLGPTPKLASLIGQSKDSDFGNFDFALLTIDSAPETIRPLAVGVDPRVLEGVVAVGYPGQGTAGDSNKITPSAIFTEGQVSVLQPQPNGVVLVVHTANIARGSSGGPLVSRCGHVVGVNTFVLSDKDNIDGRSLYALSASDLRQFMKQYGVDYQQASADCSSAGVDKAP